MNFSLVSSVSVICLCVVFSSLTVAKTKIYYWLDENGQRHYSDTAELGTTEINVVNQNVITSDNIRSATTPEKTAAVKEEPKIIYQANIISPENDSPLRSNDGSINIQVKITPESKATQKLQLFLDGKALGNPQMSSTIRVENIDRGTHQIQVQLSDESGKVLARTQVVTVHLQRVSSISAP
ncbi:conserved hypothetical protein [Psychromonas ingrahamii 37]|uniref:DUF4124 domain-containing protein n=1 Tax=Psychromonas ingrahamii (strain DSM 17664 / CCUG 51855 / 37) TaxID=357804 RepID=A1T0A4_PSYIN|nr:DUF4124 domain-containing protein [Psychromonas ingrahamii]ABM05169.1 conserved hypothetical protein [Psychromonas ingrahamii 37]